MTLRNSPMSSSLPQQQNVSAHTPRSRPTAHPCAAYAKDITPQSLVALLEAQTNLLVALSPTQTPLTALAAEFGLTLPPPETPLVSYFPARAGPHTTLPVHVPAAHALLGADTPPVLFAGVPHLLGSS